MCVYPHKDVCVHACVVVNCVRSCVNALVFTTRHIARRSSGPGIKPLPPIIRAEIGYVCSMCAKSLCCFQALVDRPWLLVQAVLSLEPRSVIGHTGRGCIVGMCICTFLPCLQASCGCWFRQRTSHRRSATLVGTRCTVAGNCEGAFC